MQLIKYEAAKRAVAAAKNVDEVKAIEQEAKKIAAYARQAKDKQLVEDAAEIRLRAERRLGEMMAVQPKARPAGPGRGKTRVKAKPEFSKPSLHQAGIDKNLAHRARRAAEVPEETFEKYTVPKARKAAAKAIDHPAPRLPDAPVDVGGLANILTAQLRSAVKKEIESRNMRKLVELRAEIEPAMLDHILKKIDFCIDDLQRLKQELSSSNNVIQIRKQS
jgi:hypothetical protein